MNSDPNIVRFFLRFLQEVGVDPSRLSYRVYVHENADVAAAGRAWLVVTGADPAQFRQPVLKRHIPRTIRKNVADEYCGCLKINVSQSADLYRRIDGWARAAMTGPAAAPGASAELG